MDTASESVFGMLRKAKVVQLKGYMIIQAALYPSGFMLNISKVPSMSTDSFSIRFSMYLVPCKFSVQNQS